MSTLTFTDFDKIKYFMDEISIEDDNFKENVLTAFKDLFGFHKGNFWLCDENNDLHLNPTSLNINQKLIRSYLDNFYEKDPIIPIHAFKKNSNSEQRVITLDKLQSNREFENSEYYNSFLKEMNLYHNLGLYLTLENKLIGFIEFPWPKNEISIKENDIMSLELIARSLSQTTVDYISKQQEEKLHTKKIQLSPREKDVFDLLVQGYTNVKIAHLLFISINTVKKHVKCIFKKYNVTNRTMLTFKVNQPDK